MTNNVVKRKKRFWQKFDAETVTNFGCLLLIGIFLVLLFGFNSIAALATQKEVIITVERRERVQTRNSSTYMVWAREDEVFTVNDQAIFFRFDSSDRYGKLKEGKKFLVKVNGLRIPILSRYRNILEIKKELK